MGDRLFSRRDPIADRSNTRTEQGGGTPDAILILLDYVGDVHDLNYAYSSAVASLAAVPTPAAAGRLTLAQVRALLRKAGRNRGIDAEPPDCAKPFARSTERRISSPTDTW